MRLLPGLVQAQGQPGGLRMTASQTSGWGQLSRASAIIYRIFTSPDASESGQPPPILQELDSAETLVTLFGYQLTARKFAILAKMLMCLWAECLALSILGGCTQQRGDVRQKRPLLRVPATYRGGSRDHCQEFRYSLKLYFSFEPLLCA